MMASGLPRIHCSRFFNPNALLTGSEVKYDGSLVFCALGSKKVTLKDACKWAPRNTIKL